MNNLNSTPPRPAEIDLDAAHIGRTDIVDPFTVWARVDEYVTALTR